MISIIYELISTNPKLLICYLSNTKEIIGKAIYNLEININNMHFYNEINAFKKIFKLKDSRIDHVFGFFTPCISGYLIQKGYLKNQQNRIDTLFTNQDNFTMMKEFDTNDYIILRNIDYGSSFAVDLIYHFKKEELFALKRPNTNDCGIKK